MPRSVAVIDMENHDDLLLTQEPLPVLPPCDVPIAAAHMSLHVFDDEYSGELWITCYLSNYE